MLFSFLLLLLLLLLYLPYLSFVFSLSLSLHISSSTPTPTPSPAGRVGRFETGNVYNFCYSYILIFLLRWQWHGDGRSMQLCCLLGVSCTVAIICSHVGCSCRSLCDQCYVLASCLCEKPCPIPCPSPAPAMPKPSPSPALALPVPSSIAPCIATNVQHATSHNQSPPVTTSHHQSPPPM